MKRASAWFVASVLGFAVVSCGDSESVTSGLGEPLVVSNGQFFSGSLPRDQGGPKITSLGGLRSSIIPAGTTGKAISGAAAPSSLSVGIELEGSSHGYWVVPVGAPDPQTDGELTWKFVCDFSRSLPAGIQTLRFGAANRDGQFGASQSLKVNALPILPDAHVVASLSWGNDADVDLHLSGPSGKELDPKHISSTDIDASTKLPLPGAGSLDRDSLANCVPDGHRTENVVWASDASAPPEAGVYTVRADLFSACGRPSTTFVFDLSIDGEVVQHQAGILLDTDADNGGPGSGLYVTQFTL